LNAWTGYFAARHTRKLCDGCLTVSDGQAFIGHGGNERWEYVLNREASFELWVVYVCTDYREEVDQAVEEGFERGG